MSKLPPLYKTVDELKTLTFDAQCSFLLVVIANRWSRGASALYRDNYGVGVVEWRCMVMLARYERDGVSAARISEVSGMNKSIVSRSLAKMEELGLVKDYEHSTSRKPRLLQFSEEGRELYKKMVEHYLVREKSLRKGLSSDEVKELLRMLRVVFDNMDDLDQLHYHIDL